MSFMRSHVALLYLYMTCRVCVASNLDGSSLTEHVDNKCVAVAGTRTSSRRNCTHWFISSARQNDVAADAESHAMRVWGRTRGGGWFKEFIDHRDPHLLGPPLRPDPQSYSALSDYLLTWFWFLEFYFDACKMRLVADFATSAVRQVAPSLRTQMNRRA